MPRLNPYRVFISHAWKHGGDYGRVVKMLDEYPNFDWQNYSVPQHDPLEANNKPKLKRELTEQISPSQVVLIISGMYASYSDWIEYELKEALRMNKPIIGIRPWGAERVPQIIQEHASEMVNWQASSIVAAIRRLVS